jgi:predicted transposase/invertase (TIGR01784 family)
MKKLLSPTNDFVFKLIFGDKRHANILAGFLKAALDLPPQNFDRLSIVDPRLKREHVDGKESILDVKVHTKSGVIINVEVQVAAYAGLRDRFLFYPAKILVSQAKRGGEYRNLAPVISIIIMENTLVPEDEGYYNEYGLINKRTGTIFSGLLSIKVLELSKLPERPDGQSPLWRWGRFFRARTEEEFMEAAAQGGEIREAVEALMEISKDEVAQTQALRREIFLMDQASLRALQYDKGREEGRQEGEGIGLVKGEEIGLAKGEVRGQRTVLELMKQGYTAEQIEEKLASQTR